MSYQVLARKYRPQSFEGVVGQEHITRTLKNAAESKRIAHGYLFSGMRGVGKTTMARILAKALNCEQGPTSSPCNQCGNCDEITQGRSLDVIEIDGASNTGVDDIRELRENVLYAPARTRYKIYIIDEVHMLSKNAFNALLKTLEEPPAHVIFVFATTESHKVPFTIKSRCQCFHFRRIPIENITEHLMGIAKQEGFGLDVESAQLIGSASEGSMRDAQSLLDQVLSFCGEAITVVDTRRALGVIDQEILDECTSALIEQDAERVLNLVDSLHSKGFDLAEFCRKLQAHLRNLLMIRILKTPGSVISLSREEIDRLQPLGERAEEDRLVSFIEFLSKTEEEVRRSSHPRILLEISLVKMTRLQPLREFREILDQLEVLKQTLFSEGRPRARGQNEKQQRPAKDSEMPMLSGKNPGQEGPQDGNHEAKVDWEEVVSEANKSDPPLGAILENGFLKEGKPHQVIIGFKKKIHYDMAEEKKTRIHELLKRFLRRDLKVKLGLQDGPGPSQQTPVERKKETLRKKNKKLQTENLKNHVVQEALRVFKGEVLEVRDFGAEAEGR